MQSSWLCLGSHLPIRYGITFLATICTFCIIIIIIVVVVFVVVVVVVYDETYCWVYLSSDYQFQVYYKVRQVLLQSATEQTLERPFMFCENIMILKYLEHPSRLLIQIIESYN